MWFASLLNNEALISISTVQLLHFFHLDFACTSPGSGLPARTVWGRSQSSPKSPSQLLQAELCQSWAEVAQMGAQSLEDALTPCSERLLPVLRSSKLRGKELPRAGSTHHRAQRLESRHTSSTRGRAQLRSLSWALLGDSLLIWEDRSRYGNALGRTQFSNSEMPWVLGGI